MAAEGARNRAELVDGNARRPVGYRLLLRGMVEVERWRIGVEGV